MASQYIKLIIGLTGDFEDENEIIRTRVFTTLYVSLKGNPREKSELDFKFFLE